MKTINLDNPIFVYYVNLNNISRVRASAIIEEIRKEINYSNISIWILPSNETRIEVLWKGNSNMLFDNSLQEISKKIKLIGEIILDGIEDNSVKQKLRNHLLNDLI